VDTAASELLLVNYVAKQGHSHDAAAAAVAAAGAAEVGDDMEQVVSSEGVPVVEANMQDAVPPWMGLEPTVVGVHDMKLSPGTPSSASGVAELAQAVVLIVR
jgi:hypothetical protein